MIECAAIMKMQDEIMMLDPQPEDPIYTTIYNALYEDNPYMPSVKSAGYQAPETNAGYAARLIQLAVNRLRLQFVITPIE